MGSPLTGGSRQEMTTHLNGLIYEVDKMRPMIFEFYQSYAKKNQNNLTMCRLRHLDITLMMTTFGCTGTIFMDISRCRMCTGRGRHFCTTTEPSECTDVLRDFMHSARLEALTTFQ